MRPERLVLNGGVAVSGYGGDVEWEGRLTLSDAGLS